MQLRPKFLPSHLNRSNLLILTPTSLCFCLLYLQNTFIYVCTWPSLAGTMVEVVKITCGHFLIIKRKTLSSHPFVLCNI